MATVIHHPRCDLKGAKVALHHPSAATPIDAWHQPSSVATVTPDGPIPARLNDIELAPWLAAPRNDAGWEHLASGTEFSEPPVTPKPGFKRAAGVVVEEADGRVWLVSPSNAFGGYKATFPKGTVEGGLSMRATAIKEAFEETGLRVELTGYLLDSVRTTSVTRYYRARRLRGHPAAVCWETQAVHLAPRSALPSLLTHTSDQLLVTLLTKASPAE